MGAYQTVAWHIGDLRVTLNREGARTTELIAHEPVVVAGASQELVAPVVARKPIARVGSPARRVAGIAFKTAGGFLKRSHGRMVRRATWKAQNADFAFAVLPPAGVEAERRDLPDAHPTAEVGALSAPPLVLQAWSRWRGGPAG